MTTTIKLSKAQIFFLDSMKGLNPYAIKNICPEGYAIHAKNWNTAEALVRKGIIELNKIGSSTYATFKS
tara:strand:+ start:301 stop:507 length:207 start_codon:yes stop_codon:yes gene_type:complete